MQKYFDHMMANAQDGAIVAHYTINGKQPVRSTIIGADPLAYLDTALPRLKFDQGNLVELPKWYKDQFSEVKYFNGCWVVCDPDHGVWEYDQYGREWVEVNA